MSPWLWRAFSPARDTTRVLGIINRAKRNGAFLSLRRSRQFDEDHNFIDPVVQKWPGLAREYRSKIKEPMDIVTMIQNVRRCFVVVVAVACAVALVGHQAQRTHVVCQDPGGSSRRRAGRLRTDSRVRRQTSTSVPFHPVAAPCGVCSGGGMIFLMRVVAPNRWS
jgi:hypothetical protein